jgi:hypothetical protein
MDNDRVDAAGAVPSQEDELIVIMRLVKHHQRLNLAVGRFVLCLFLQNGFDNPAILV